MLRRRLRLYTALSLEELASQLSQRVLARRRFRTALDRVTEAVWLVGWKGREELMPRSGPLRYFLLGCRVWGTNQGCVEDVARRLPRPFSSTRSRREGLKTGRWICATKSPGQTCRTTDRGESRPRLPFRRDLAFSILGRPVEEGRKSRTRRPGPRAWSRSPSVNLGPAQPR